MSSGRGRRGTPRGGRTGPARPARPASADRRRAARRAGSSRAARAGAAGRPAPGSRPRPAPAPCGQPSGHRRSGRRRPAGVRTRITSAAAGQPASRVGGGVATLRPATRHGCSKQHHRDALRGQRLGERPQVAGLDAAAGAVAEQQRRDRAAWPGACAGGPRRAAWRPSGRVAFFTRSPPAAAARRARGRCCARC